MLSRRLFEGPNIQKVLARIQTELGPAAQVVSAEKVRRGGVGGFFTRETYQVIVESPEEAPARPSLWSPWRRPDRSVLVPAVPEELAAAQRMVAVPSTEGAPFAEVLRRLTENAEPPAPGGPAPAGPAAAGPAAVAAGTEPAATTMSTTTSVDAVVDEDLMALLRQMPAARVVAESGPEPDTAETWLSESENAGGGDSAAGGVALAQLQAVPLPAANGKQALMGVTPARARPALKKMGLPTSLLPADGRLGLVPALYRSLSRMPMAPPVCLQQGEVMAVIGAADRALLLASRLALSIGLDPGEVVLATPAEDGDPGSDRVLISSGAAAGSHAEEWAARPRPTVVSIAAAPGSGREAWASNVIEALQPAAVWGVVEATRKPEDVSAWSRAVGQVDALALEDMDATTSPAAVLGTGIPVALLDGQLASPEAWTALLAGRLRSAA